MDDFDKTFNGMQKAQYVMIAFGMLVTCAVVSGIGFAVYKILVYFDVM